MSEARISYLLERYFAKTCTPAEKEELAAILLQAENDDVVKRLVEKTWQHYSPDEQIPVETADRYFNKILQQAGHQTPVRRIPFLKTAWLRYAAAVILLSGIGAYGWYYFSVPVRTTAINYVPLDNDIAPGKPGAILTLADGSEVMLDSLGNGIIATQGGSQVVLGKGQLAYNAGAADAAAVTYNTMTTPKGRQFQLLLPDGSKVWLNAASSIKYPTFFSGTERTVAINGEAYFEVTRNDQMPFKVQINASTEVTVLGTHFNINSYAGEASINTTLLEGSVSVTAGSEKIIIRPGEQAQVKLAAGEQQLRVIKDTDVNNAVAWKNGYFRFDGMDLPMVMREISRWYDVEVEYKGTIPEKQFGGELPRSISLRNLLKLIEFGDIQLDFSGNHITIIGDN